MKSITTKEFISLVAIAVAAPVLTLAVLNVSVMLARGNSLLLLALTLCGAVVSGINGFGRRTVNASSASRSSREGPHSTVALPSWVFQGARTTRRRNDQQQPNLKEQTQMISKFFRDETGLELSEYAVAAALVAIAVVGAFTALGTAISGKITTLGTTISK
jgi:pilus assembly protein Flp/PilA